MYSLLQNLGLQLAVRKELLPFLIAFTLAEFFFKFKSFALECLAFLFTWYVLSLMSDKITGQAK